VLGTRNKGTTAVAVRLPDDELAAITSLAARRGVNRADLLRSLIRTGFDVENDVRQPGHVTLSSGEGLLLAVALVDADGGARWEQLTSGEQQAWVRRATDALRVLTTTPTVPEQVRVVTTPQPTPTTSSRVPDPFQLP
jgi:hypothetical protein